MNEEIPQENTREHIDLNAIRDAALAGEAIDVPKPNHDGMTPEQIHYSTSPHFANPATHGPSGPSIDELRKVIAKQYPEDSGSPKA